MKRKFMLAIIAVATTVLGVTYGQPAQDDGPADGVVAKIAWYSTLESGLAEAKRSQRPILLISAAPQCLGVPGTW